MTTACYVAMLIKKTEHFLELANMSLFDLLGNSVPVVELANWNLEMFIFVEEGKPENPEKTLGAWREPTTNSMPGYHPTWATLTGSEYSHRRCAITALYMHCFIEMLKKLLPVINNLHLTNFIFW